MPHVPTIVNGEKLPSVTEICGVLEKPFLYRWYGTHGWAECERIKKESQERGSRLHKEIENRISPYRNDPPVTSAEVIVLLEWAKLAGFVPLKIEEHVVSRIYRYGGTYDIKGTLPKGRKAILDWKFGSQINETHPLQGSGYDQANFESTGERMDEFRVLRPYSSIKPAKEDSIKEIKGLEGCGYRYSFKGCAMKIEERIYRGLPHYFSIFLKLREVYDYVRGKGMWEK